MEKNLNDQDTFHVESKMDPAMNGNVTVHVPNAGELVRIGAIGARLRKGTPLQELDDLTLGFVTMLSTLSVVVCEAPDWWYRTEGEGRFATRVPAPELIHDIELLWDMYDRYVNWRETFPARKGRESVQPHESEGAASEATIS